MSMTPSASAIAAGTRQHWVRHANLAKSLAGNTRLLRRVWSDRCATRARFQLVGSLLVDHQEEKRGSWRPAAFKRTAF